VSHEPCPWGQNREFCVAGSHKVFTARVNYTFDLKTCLMRNAGVNELQFTLCNHVITMDTRRPTNADKMVTNSGQPGELQPCKFPILKSINYLDHLSLNVKIRYQEKINILETCDLYTAPAHVFIALI